MIILCILLVVIIITLVSFKLKKYQKGYNIVVFNKSSKKITKIDALKKGLIYCPLQETAVYLPEGLVSFEMNFSNVLPKENVRISIDLIVTFECSLKEELLSQTVKNIENFSLEGLIEKCRKSVNDTLSGYTKDLQVNEINNEFINKAKFDIDKKIKKYGFVLKDVLIEHIGDSANK